MTPQEEGIGFTVKIKAQVHWYLSLASQQNHQSLTSFIHIILFLLITYKKIDITKHYAQGKHSSRATLPPIICKQRLSGEKYTPKSHHLIAALLKKQPPRCLSKRSVSDKIPWRRPILCYAFIDDSKDCIIRNL